jgi:hypothetical protein
MLSPVLATQTITRIRPAQVTNRYGDLEADWDNASSLDIVGCALHPAGTTETTDPARTAVAIRWNLFLPPGSDIVAGDRVSFDGVLYEVDGMPLAWMGASSSETTVRPAILDHIAAQLVRVEG